MSNYIGIDIEPEFMRPQSPQSPQKSGQKKQTTKNKIWIT